ncbi:MAG: hypothetical protein ABIQ44_08020 [Chloroflexia bacterium]
MKSSIRNSQSAIALALVAAIAVLVAAWLLPLPRLLLSGEEDAAKRMPQTQADVEKAYVAFGASQQSYMGYVATHDVSVELATFEQAIQKLQSEPNNEASLSAVQTAARPASDYATQLLDYLKSGDVYFAQLSHYDDELMAWTRSLGTNSDLLRRDTWPIADYLTRYPPPFGIQSQYSVFKTSGLQGTIDALSSNSPNANAATYATLLADIREAGRSIEYSESLNAGYGTLLDNYHTRLVSVASNPQSSAGSGGRTILAIISNSVLAVVIIAGLAALFFQRKSAPNEAAS